MKKRIKQSQGFTLIELLAVIVILAIIALIATPIILGIINDAKSKTRENSVNGYVETIKLEVTKYALNYAGTTPDFNEDYLDKLPYQGDKVTCGLDGETPGVYYSDEYGVVLHGCKVGSDKTLYYYANGIYKDKNESKYKEIFDLITGNVAITGNPIEEYAKALVYNGDTCKTDGSTYQYMGGCYIKGASTNNYVWYSGFLWRLMGINSDGTIRLIAEENVTAISYNVEDNANFNGSYADKWLNDYFLSHLKGTNVIVNGSFCQGATGTSNASARSDCTDGEKLARKVGLLSIDEYNLASAGSSYFVNGQFFWTMSSLVDAKLLAIYNNGVIDSSVSSDTFGLRAIINVSSDAIITGGNGTLNGTWAESNSPYILNENKSGDIVGTLGNKASSGEYVLFGDKTYRVVSQSNGTTRLLLDGYYQEVAGKNYLMAFGTDNIFTTASGVGQKLNTDVLNNLAPTDEMKNRILPSIWYQNIYDYGDSYEVSLNEINPTRKIENVKVGLIRVGEMLSGISYTILTKNGTAAGSFSNAQTYWTLTSYTSNLFAWHFLSSGLANNYKVSTAYGLLPVIQVSANSTIIGGNGTPGSPYKI